jgi:small subunit ribosomal protein S9e
MPKSYRLHTKTSDRPRKLFDRDRQDREIKLAGEYGLKNKREIWRIQLVLAKIRKRARELLTLEEGNPIRVFEGQALMTKLFKYGLLDKEAEQGLDFALSLTIERFLERRLQTLVYKNKLANSVHEARTKIFGRHIRVSNRIVDVASYMVSVDNETKIELNPYSALGGERKGRIAKKKKD